MARSHCSSTRSFISGLTSKWNTAWEDVIKTTVCLQAYQLFRVWKNQGTRETCQQSEGKQQLQATGGPAVKTAYLCTNLMHDMTELMEESPHLIVSQERRPACDGLWEVDHQGGHRHHPAAIREKAAWLETKASCMVVFSFPGRQKRRAVTWTLFFSTNRPLPSIKSYSRTHVYMLGSPFRRQAASPYGRGKIKQWPSLPGFVSFSFIFKSVYVFSCISVSVGPCIPPPPMLFKEKR